MSRPRRTRVYNANYNIGESYYKPTLDRLDRKFLGKPLEVEKSPTPIARDIQDRYERAFQDDDLPTARRRAEKHITEDNLFDSRSAHSYRNGNSHLLSSFDADHDIDEEVAGTLKRIRANNKKIVEDIDLEGTVSSITTKRGLGMAEKLLDSVGINEVSARRIKNGESALTNRRSVALDEEMAALEAPISAKWTALRDEETSGAALRAKQSRARLQDLEDEMEALNERQVARERRLANLRSIMADNEDTNGFSSQSQQQSQQLQSSMKSTRISARSEKKTVTF